MSQAANLSAMMSGTTITVPNLTYTGTLTGVSQNLSGNLTANNIVSSNNVTYSGTLTGGTGVIAIGTNQIYKDASGNVGIGTSSPQARLHIYGGAYNQIRIDSSGTQANLALYSQYDSGGTTRNWTIASNVLQYGDLVIKQSNTQGGDPLSGTARMVIDFYGNLLVGTTTAPSQGKMNILNGFQMMGVSTGTFISSNNGSAEVAYLSLGASYNVAGSYDVALGIDNIATTAGKRIIIQNRTLGVYVADGGTSWTSNSDERLKTDLKPIENAAQKVSSLRAVTGRYIVDEENVSRSFLIAQDVQAVLPEAVDASDPDKLGVQYTDTIPLLVAAIKELTTRLEALEAQ